MGATVNLVITVAVASRFTVSGIVYPSCLVSNFAKSSYLSSSAVFMPFESVAWGWHVSAAGFRPKLEPWLWKSYGLHTK